MSEKIVVCLEKGGARDMAEAFSRRTNTPISEKPGEHLTVLFNSKGVSLTGYGLAYQDRKSTRLNSSHTDSSRMPSSA